MSALYNEIEPFAAQWLRNLVSAGHVAAGAVDERPIQALGAEDITAVQAHFFAGIGVWSYALKLAGWPDSRPVWTGSCPCQPFSAAGKRAGTADPRHLWPEWFRLIRECRPSVIFGEQVASAGHWLDLVSADLEGEGYAFGAAVLGAHSVGAPHIRQRLYFVAHASGERLDGLDPLLLGGRPQQDRAQAAGSSETGLVGARERQAALGGSNASFWSDAEWIPCRDGKSRPVEPGTFPLAHGATSRVGRLRAYGNALNAEQAATFIRAAMSAQGGAR